MKLENGMRCELEKYSDVVIFAFDRSCRIGHAKLGPKEECPTYPCDSSEFRQTAPS
jgi:hypothetical protein